MAWKGWQRARKVMVVYSSDSDRKVEVGDIVELLPTNQRNRQLRSQDNKLLWEVLEIRRLKWFGDEIHFDIKHLGSDHSRWVKREEIEIDTFRENRI